jgi:hypothetical protein
MDKRPSSMQLYWLRCNPNGLMERFLAIIVVLNIRGVGLMVRILSMTISLFHVALF